MQNAILDESMAGRAVDRSLQRRRDAYAQEIRRLVEAALALIRETGSLEPRVGEIVRAAGLSNQAFYRHFRSKHELLVAVLDEGIQLLRGYLEHRMNGAGSPKAQVEAWLSGMLAQAVDPEAAVATRPFALSRGRLAELHPGEVQDSERQLTALVREALAAAGANGELPGVEPERDAEMLYDLSMAWLQRQLASGAPASAEDARHLVAFAMRGLERPAADA